MRPTVPKAARVSPFRNRPTHETHIPAEYDVDGVLWKVEASQLLKKEFGVNPDELSDFHKSVCHLDGFIMVKMFYGIHEGSEIDPVKVMGLRQIRVELGIDSPAGKDRQETLMRDVAAVWWKARDGKVCLTQDTSSPETPLPEAPKPKEKKKPNLPAIATSLPRLTAQDDALLKRFGFSDDMFSNNANRNRKLAEMFAEREWFVQRVRELEKLLEETMVASLTRQALQNELLSRRVSDMITQLDPTTKQFENLQSTKSALENQYRDQWKQIESLCPFARTLTIKNVVGGQLSDLVLGIQEYMANSDNTVIDGIFTNYEIQILLRDADQHPVRYRPAQVAYLVDAMNPESLWNPDWKSQYPQRILKAIDAGFQEGYTRAREGAAKPNLEGEGPESEYPKLEEPKQEEDSLEEPVNTVPIEPPAMVPG